ncbi:hypothetical protein PQX77_021705 [Marasmius sp. AFHP31]|nr:hypothetical protein PQX77_021705 [Marasmius sp. AFHP31]
MSNTPDANATTTPSQPEDPLDLTKVADENQAIAAALRKAQMDNQALTSRLKDARIGVSEEPTSSISSKASSKASESSKSSAATEA